MRVTQAPVTYSLLELSSTDFDLILVLLHQHSVTNNIASFRAKEMYLQCMEAKHGATSR